MYELGGVAVLTWTATDTTGAPANAGVACTITITQPDGSTAGPFIVTGTAGAYSYAYQTRQSGRHTYRFEATGIPGPGVGVGAHTDVFDVYLASPSTIISLADAKELLRIAPANTTFDADLKFFCESLTAFIDLFCGPMVPRQVTERHTAGARTLMLRKIPVYKPAGQPHDIVSITPVLTYGVPYDDLSLLSVDYASGEMVHTIGLPFYYGYYDIVYWAGRSYIPPNVILAAQVILKHWWSLERPSARPGQGAVGGAADDTVLLWGFAIPNRALEMLESERTPAGIR
jgi:hypothetical protein